MKPKTNVVPVRGYCLIEPLEADEVSAGGVILPERMKDMPQRGKVLAMGEPSYEAIDKVGYPRAIEDLHELENKTVIFKRFVDNRIKEEGKELLLVKFEDILGIYE